MMMQPSNPPSLTPVSSNVDVVENLTNHDPSSHVVGYHTALGPRTRDQKAGKCPVVAPEPSSNFRYNNEDTDTPSISTDLTNPPSVL